MRISTFFYTIRQGFRNIFRNKLFSLASIATITACLFMFGIFYSVVVNLQSMVKNAEEGVCVTVFFENGTEDAVIQEIGHGRTGWRAIPRSMRKDLRKIRWQTARITECI